MAENSKIEWTDHTLNLWWGCAKVHTGCKNCYAEYLSETRYSNGVWGEKAPRKRIKSAFPNLNKWQKTAASKGELKKVFCGSMMDIFEESKPTVNANGEALEFEMDGHSGTGWLRHELFCYINIGMYPNLIFQFLTKRPENIKSMIPKNWVLTPPENVWIGTSCSDQDTFNTYSKRLINNWRGNKFLSVEPQVGIIDVVCGYTMKQIDWVIQGGESGHKKRPFDIEWASHMKSICKSTKTPYFFKQIDKVQEIPENLKIRQFPKF